MEICWIILVKFPSCPLWQSWIVMTVAVLERPGLWWSQIVITMVILDPHDYGGPCLAPSIPPTSCPLLKRMVAPEIFKMKSLSMAELHHGLLPLL